MTPTERALLLEVADFIDGKPHAQDTTAYRSALTVRLRDMASAPVAEHPGIPGVVKAETVALLHEHVTRIMEHTFLTPTYKERINFAMMVLINVFVRNAPQMSCWGCEIGLVDDMIARSLMTLLPPPDHSDDEPHVGKPDINFPVGSE